MKSQWPARIVLLCVSCILFPAAALAEAAEIQKRIDDAIRAHESTVSLPAGTVRLEAPLKVRSARDLEVDGRGTTLILGFTSGTAIQVYDCSNVTFRGFTVDSDPLPFTQGTILSKEDAGLTCDFRVHDGYPSLSDDYRVTHIHAFEPARVRWKERAPDLYARRVVALEPRRGRIEFGTRKEDYGALEVGDRIVLNKREGCGMRFDRCQDVRVEGVTFLSAPGGAVLARYMRGDNRFSYDIRPGPPPSGATEPRLMSTCADAFNYAYARRGPTLERCHFSFMGDDSVNLHGFTFLVLAVVSPTELRVGWPYARESVEWVVASGDPARWLKAGNFAVAGSSPITSFRWDPKPDPKFQERIEAYWPRGIKGRGAVFALNVAKPLGAVEGDAIDLPASSAPGFSIRCCEFADHRARGTRIMAADGIIEDNLFRRIKQAAISLGPEYVFWREAGWVEDVVVKGNRIEDCGLSPDMWRPSSCTLGAISVFARKESSAASMRLASDNQRIAIEENNIDGCSLAAVWARGARDVVVRGNKISRVNLHDGSGAGTAEGFDVRGPVDVK